MTGLVLTDSQLRQFASDGLVVVPGVVGTAYLDAADREIDEVISTEPPPPDLVGKHFYFLSPERLPAAHAALRDSRALAIAEELTAPETLELILDHIQIALNIPSWSHRPGGPHIDGQVLQRPGQDRPDSFTLLAGIFLTDEAGADDGSVWVWPGSHLTHAQLFRERGPNALLATGGHISLLDSAPPLRDPVAVAGKRGDLLLAHFLLGHNTGGNVSSRIRRMLYYRLGCTRHAARWEQTFTDAFLEFAPVRAVQRA